MATMQIGGSAKSAAIRRYDSPGTLFYLDPPYWGCEDDYGKAMFSAAAFGQLATQLGSIRGKFLMSINDVEPIREAFADFTIQPVTTSYTVGTKNDRRGSRAELLIGNFDMPELVGL